MVSSINNLIIGKIYVDHGGVMRISSSSTGMVCKLKFREQGLLSRHEAHEVGARPRTARAHAKAQASTNSFVPASRSDETVVISQPCAMYCTRCIKFTICMCR